MQGGRALAQYPDFHKVVRDDDGVYRVHDRRVALRHRLSIGTITSDGSVQRAVPARWRGWARWKSSSSRGCARATASSSPAACWNWCGWRT